MAEDAAEENVEVEAVDGVGVLELVGALLEVLVLVGLVNQIINYDAH